MARPIRKNPIPTIRKRGTSFYLRWYAQGAQYELSLGAITKDEANAICAITAAALAKGGDFPQQIINEPALKRFLNKHNSTTPKAPDNILIERYIRHTKMKNPESLWPASVKTHLNNALAFIGRLNEAPPNEIQNFLEAESERTSNATSNRAHAVLSGFYKWLRKTGVHTKYQNPMQEISKRREQPPPDGIVTWEPNEVRILLRRVKRRHDGIAVWIAILAGLRRGEIARLAWEDITPAYIIVQKSKTGAKRQVPLSKALAEQLAKEPRNGRKVVPWPEATYGWIAASRKLINIYLPRFMPKLHKAHPEKFGWNPFRHTFASRLAQQGLSLDIIAAWLGDSPKVCKEHYARYVPKSRRDDRIDAVDMGL